jgi:hypothetical protein
MPRPASQRPAFFRPTVPGRAERIIELYAQNLSVTDVAARMGVSTGCVNNTLKVRGLMRTRSQGRTLAYARAKRRAAIAAAAQKVFGHLWAPASAAPRAAPVHVPVNAMFDDAVPGDDWRYL